ncbi:NEDD8 ultimate buster 1-like [Styela clava]
MASETQAATNKVKNHLRVKSVKLWLPPYTKENGEIEADAINTLALEFSKKIKIPENIVVICLNELWHHTVERLRQNENYKTNKIATLKLKRSSTEKVEFEIVETNLNVSGEELKKLVTEKLKLSEDVKLICGGRVIQKDSSLESQHVKHNSVILCLVIAQSARKESSEVEQALKAVKRARKGAELLAEMGAESSDMSGAYDVQIADQKGQALDLPEEEKRSLTIALGLHEKGRAILQRKNYELALLLLLEADKEFRECRAEILTMVDNYAVLCLDIVWCYVCTKNISALPDAKLRLKECESAFNKSYGDSLQRLLAVKGSSGNEIALFVRLYLLQGVVFYHEGQYKESNRLLDKAQGYAKMVVTDQDKVTELMTMGLAEREARRALRANMMDVKLATQWAFKQREEHKEIKKQEKEKKRKKALQKKFGTCANEDPINIDTYEQLVSQMGFEPTLVVEALKHANNDVGGAIEMIDSNPDQLREAVRMNAEENMKKNKKSALQQLKAMGFDEGVAKACLEHFSGELEEAASYLAEHLGEIPSEWISSISSALEDTDTASSSRKLTEDEKAMVHDVAGDVTKHTDEYLDISLSEELELIVQYLTMIESVSGK